MTVLENVMIGAHCRARGGFFADALALPFVRREETRIRERAMALVQEFALDAVAQPEIGERLIDACISLDDRVPDEIDVGCDAHVDQNHE